MGDRASRDRRAVEGDRAMIAFVVEHGRLPSTDESTRLGFGFVSSGGVDAVPRTLRFLRELVRFYDEHGRMAEDDELNSNS